MKTWPPLIAAAIGFSLPLSALAQETPAPETPSRETLSLEDPTTSDDGPTGEQIEALADEISEEMERSEAQTTDDQAMAQEIREYAAKERLIGTLVGGFVPYQPTYILPYTYVDTPNQHPFSPRVGEADYDTRLQDEEAKYQISFRVPLLTGMLDDETTLWFGYTQKSFWQVYNTRDSAPFRETNYEPELFVRHRLGWNLGPGELTSVTIGLNHQSNGQSEPRSRSWNRIKGSVSYTYNRWLFMVNPWYRLPEKGSDDDNPDIDEYLGYADYIAVYKWNDDHVVTTRLMNNLRSDNNRTSVELAYSFPIGGTLKGYVQYYNGYGESLIDYNERIQRIGIGIMLNDWL